MGYTKYEYQVVKLDKMPYYTKADYPEKIVAQQWKKALEASQYWHLPAYRRKYFSTNDNVARQVRPMLHIGGRVRGASFATAAQFEDVPYGNNESDLDALRAEHERRYKQATLDNTSNRVKMMLGMLGDVQVIDSKDMSYAAKSMLMYGTKYKVFMVKDCKLVLFEPEEVK